MVPVFVFGLFIDSLFRVFMAVIRKSLQPLDLEKFRVWVEDTSPFSTYFRLAELPEILYSGKNSFLINGSPFLTPDSEVLVEIKDANGNPIFIHPIPRYKEGLARVVSIEIYPDTPNGMGTLTIMGVLSRDINGNPVPFEFERGYGVRWRRPIMINTTRVTDSPIRLYKKPVLTVEEVRLPNRSFQIISTTSSLGSITGSSLLYSDADTTARKNEYIITSDVEIFLREMIGGSFHATIDGTGFTSSIKSVRNTKIAELDVPFTSASSFVGFQTNNFNINYTYSASVINTTQTMAYAKINLSNLRSFSGNINRVKILQNRKNAFNGFELLEDTLLENVELLVTNSFGRDDTLPPWISGKLGTDISTGIPYNFATLTPSLPLVGDVWLVASIEYLDNVLFNERIGYFFDQSIIDNYWISGHVTESVYST